MQDYLLRYRLPSKIVSDVGTNFITEKFKNFCKRLSIWHSLSPTYIHQSNGQAEACIKFVKKTMKKCYKTNAYIHMCSLLIRSVPINLGY